MRGLSRPGEIECPWGNLGGDRGEGTRASGCSEGAVESEMVERLSVHTL